MWLSRLLKSLLTAEKDLFGFFQKQMSPKSFATKFYLAFIIENKGLSNTSVAKHSNITVKKKKKKNDPLDKMCAISCTQHYFH